MTRRNRRIVSNRNGLFINGYHIVPEAEMIIKGGKAAMQCNKYHQNRSIHAKNNVLIFRFISTTETIEQAVSTRILNIF